MSFDVSGIPSTFEKTINTIHRPLLSKEVLIYLGDIIVMEATFEEHLRLLREIFTLLRNARLTVNFDKCKFFRKYIKYLSVNILQEEIKTDSEKTGAITSSMSPLNIVSRYQRS